MEKLELIKTIKELENIKGTGTQLISLYIPGKFPASELNKWLTEEYSEAGNIKSKGTRKNVQAAISKILNYLKHIDYRIPENGLVIFCGNVSGHESISDIKMWVVEPPFPVPRIYKCDDKFYLEPLKENLFSQDFYIVAVMDGDECTIAKVIGKRIEIVSRIKSLAGPKHHKGGQSARRFQRIHEIEVHEYHKSIADVINKIVQENYKNIKGILIGGPGPHKEEFINKDLLNHMAREKLIGVVDCSYVDEYGVREAIEKGKNILKESELIKEKELINKFKEEIIKDGLVCYGLKETLEALYYGKVDTLLISEDFKLIKYKYKCEKCGKEIETFEAGKMCCNQPMKKISEEDVTEKLLEIALSQGTKVEIISTETPEGVEFKEGFGGIGGFLRYK
jgi:peptide chain release factor subunit 1